MRYVKKYVDMWYGGVHDLLMKYEAIFLESPIKDLAPESPHILRSLLACAPQLFSRSLDVESIMDSHCPTRPH